MTPSRASVLRVLSEYGVLGYELSLLEVQKLLYFLQVAGEPLRLRFEQGPYGPYADNLRHVLSLFEGHFIQGFGAGDNRPRTPIRLVPEAVLEATRICEANVTPEHRERVQKVFRLIEGFESPYGMELLSSVHWVATQGSADRNDVDSVVVAVHGWNPRKRSVMKPPHISLAWNRLRDLGWLSNS